MTEFDNRPFIEKYGFPFRHSDHYYENKVPDKNERVLAYYKPKHWLRREGSNPGDSHPTCSNCNRRRMYEHSVIHRPDVWVIVCKDCIEKVYDTSQELVQ